MQSSFNSLANQEATKRSISKDSEQMGEKGCGNSVELSAGHVVRGPEGSFTGSLG